MALAPGTRLGLCEVAAQIGMGGTGEVYRATDTKLARDVAITFWLAASAAMLVMLPVPLLAQENGTFEVQAVRASEPIVIDGELSEADWASAEPVTDFFQKEPQEGAPASEATEVRILFDTRQLYIGVIAHDSDPSGIRATELRRDDGFGSDDIFEFVLDTFHDHRNGYLFRINPLGTLYDATITNEGQNTNRNWDEQWEATAQITDEGWVAEIAIPFKSLRFEASEEVTWGINFHREIKRKNEDVYWTAYSRDLSFDELSQAGHLEGLSEIQGFTLRVKPFFTSGGSQVVRRGRTETDHLTDIGIEDAKFMITPQLVLDMTVNPDFGQADVDEAQVNLTRFSRFFAERREFFQEGGGYLPIRVRRFRPARFFVISQPPHRAFRRPGGDPYLGRAEAHGAAGASGNRSAEYADATHGPRRGDPGAKFYRGPSEGQSPRAILRRHDVHE